MKLKQVQPSKMEVADLAGAAFKFATGLELSAGTADDSAERALGSVQRKLDKANSVEFTVNDLIQQATDPWNLASMYYGKSVCALLNLTVTNRPIAGWSAYL